jgi:hypothetical protein
MNKNHDKSMWPDPGFNFGFGAAPAAATPTAASSSANDFTWTMDKKLPAMWPDPGFSFGAAPAAMWPDPGVYLYDGTCSGDTSSYVYFYLYQQ